MQKSRDVAGATRLESGWWFGEMHFQRSQKPKGFRCTMTSKVLQDHSFPSLHDNWPSSDSDCYSFEVYKISTKQ